MTSEHDQQGIELRLATSEDAWDMVNFHNSYYGARRSPEHWLWEYQTYEPGKAVMQPVRMECRPVISADRVGVHCASTL